MIDNFRDDQFFVHTLQSVIPFFCNDRTRDLSNFCYSTISRELANRYFMKPR